MRESNKPQTIETFKYIKLDDTPVDPATVPEILSMSDQEREAAREDVRILVIFLDDYHTHLSSSMRIRTPLANFVRGLNPHDLVAIVTPLMPVTLITFSHDLEGMASEIMNFTGRKYNYQPKYPIEEQLAFLNPATIEQTRNTVVVAALQALCAYMGTLRDGRKTLLYVSEGMTGDVQNGTIMSTTSRGAPSTTSNNLVSQDLNQDLIDVFAAASRSNTSVYTMDPRGLAATAYEMGDPGSSQISATADQLLLTNQIDVLRTIADQTGGRAILGSNDPKPALQQMLRDTSGYYLLGYTSTEKPRDGKFHPISVRVNRKDVEIRARKGYYAYSADDVAKAMAAAEAEAASGDHRSPGLGRGAGTRSSLPHLGGGREGPRRQGRRHDVLGIDGTRRQRPGIEDRGHRPRVGQRPFRLGRAGLRRRSQAGPESVDTRRQRVVRRAAGRGPTARDGDVGFRPPDRHHQSRPRRAGLHLRRRLHHDACRVQRPHGPRDAADSDGRRARANAGPRVLEDRAAPVPVPGLRAWRHDAEDDDAPAQPARAAHGRLARAHGRRSERLRRAGWPGFARGRKLRLRD